MRKRQKREWLGTVALLVLGVFGRASISLAQELTLQQPLAGDRVVAGKATLVSVPITIFDTSFEVRTALGSTTITDAEGNFAVSVDPPLAQDHVIIAVDANGRVSPPFPVLSISSPAGGP